MNFVTTERRCEICGACNKLMCNFIYDAEFSYDDYYQTDSVKVCPCSLKLECIDCHKKECCSSIAKNYVY